MQDLDDKFLEKRLNRIERWLKRCVVACRCGSWSAALMEVECMEAETRTLREDIWRAAEAEAGCAKRVPLKQRAWLWGKVAAIAAVFVLAAGIPLSIDQDRPFQGFSSDSVALLTSTEAEILSALRDTLSQQNEGRVILAVEIDDRSPALQPVARGAALASEPRETTPARRAVPSVGGQRAPSVRVEPLPPRQEPVGKEPSVEDVISLIQVGQRALRASESAVRVIPE